ncbi:MAG TPA: DinB family protein [Ktedonobacteraceae bacterium]|nr:DinB family protein [Ktedonobacteraceae bacterium]
MMTVESSFEKVRRKLVTARIEFMGQLAKFSKEELLRPPVADDWSPLQIAHHLYIADGMALEQMRRIQEEDEPLLENIAEEAPAQTRTSEAPASLDAVLAGMAARREEIFEYLSTLPDEGWERPFRHPAWGTLKFYQMVNVLPAHDQQHTQQLAAIKAAI